MRLRHLVRDMAAAGVLAATTISPAQAGDHASPGSVPVPMPMPDTRPVWKPGLPPMPPMGAQVPAAAQGLDPRARDEWLAECRQRYASADRGLGGALIGGTVGGLLGNRIAGKHHRTTGTLAGAAVGAVAGAVINRAEDAGKARDYCESYLDDYYARAAQSYPQGYGYGYAQAYGYAVPMMMVPMMAVTTPMPQRPHCREVVTYEYVSVPVRRRHIHRTPRPLPDKRIRIVPDKRQRAD